MLIKVEVDDLAVRRMLKAGSRIARQAGKRVLNRAGIEIRKRAVKGIAQQLNLPVQKPIRQRVYVRQASVSRLEMTVIIYSRPLNLARFRPRVTRKGITVLRRRIPRAFVAGSKIGTGLRVFSRRDPSVKRLPITPENVPFAKEAEQISGLVAERVAATRINRDLPREIAFRMSRA